MLLSLRDVKKPTRRLTIHQMCRDRDDVQQSMFDQSCEVQRVEEEARPQHEQLLTH